jgi:hypothetical protein
MAQFWTVFITVISGVLVYVISELLKTLWLEPLQNYKKIKGQISYIITMYANIYTNPIDIAKTNNILPDDYKVAYDELRKKACELRAFIATLFWLKIFIPKKKNLYEVSACLIGLSNSLVLPYNTNSTPETNPRIKGYCNRICKLLKLEEIY